MTRQVGEPRPGYFRMHKIKGGPLVRCEIRHEPTCDPETGQELERSPIWKTYIDDQLVRTPSPDPTAAGVWQVWLHAEEITESMFRWMGANRTWHAEHAPDHPVANPDQPINIAAMPPRHFLPRKKRIE